MPKYVIERSMADAGKLSPNELKGVLQKSRALLREHARRDGFPADRISTVRSIIDPTTAESWTDRSVRHSNLRCATRRLKQTLRYAIARHLSADSAAPYWSMRRAPSP